MIIIIKLLSYRNNFKEIKNILKIPEKNIISILKIINEKSNEIHALFNKEKNNKIKLIDIVEINQNEDLNCLYYEFENLINNKSLEFIDITDVIEKYIIFNNKNIESLLLFKKIINKADEKINISIDINEKIHELILTLDVDSRIKYFKNDDFYFKEKYKSKRALKILDGFDLDKLIELNEKLKKEEETNLEKIFDIEELYNEIKRISNNIKDIEKLENFFVEINEEQKNIMKNILENNLSNSKITLTNEDINIIIKFYNTYNYSLEEKLIIKLLDNTNNFNQMNKILGIIDKNDIISFFKIIIHKIIIKICKKEKNKAKKLKLDDYVKLKSDDDINQFFNEVNNNKNSLDCFEISSKVFKEYIRINQDNNIDFFLNLEKLFKLFCKDANLENEINEIIDNKIKGLNIEEKVNYFLGNEININEENKYKKKRALNMLDGLDIDSLINLNNKLKKEKKINIEQIFSSQKNELYTKIISAIKNIKDIKSIYFSELIKEENQNLNKYLVIKFEKLLKEISDENNHIKDISDLIIYCINKKLDLENKLIEILKKDNNKNIYKEVIIQLINTEESSMIKKCFNYLEDNNILFLNIINQQKDIIKKYIKKEGTKIEFKNSFNPKNKDELIIQLNLLINNSLKSSMSFKPKNFELIIKDKIILEYVIQNINKENHLVEWDEMIKENINDLIKKGDLKNIELLKLINLENNIDKKKEYLTIDVFDGIKAQDLNENEYNVFINEFNKSKLIEIFPQNYEQINNKIIPLIASIINKTNKLDENISSTLEQIISQYKQNINIVAISNLVYLITKNIKSDNALQIALDKIIKCIDDESIKTIYLEIENKDLSELCRDIFIKYLFNGDKVENIINLIKFNNNKTEILKRIETKLVFNATNIVDLINQIEKNDEKYILLNEIKKLKIINDEHNDIEYFKLSKINLNELIKQLKEVKYSNYQIIEKHLKNSNLIDFLYFDEEEKNKDVKEINDKINWYKSCKFNIIIISIISVTILMSFLISKLLFQINSDKNETLVEINWNIFNKSKELIHPEYEKYSFKEVTNIENKEYKNSDINKNSEKEKLNDIIIIGIDFGSINTGYSYTITSKNDPNQIHKIISEKKSPNEIEISRDGQKGLKYSYKASVSLSNYRYEELKQINFIKGIKSLIYMDKYHNDNLCYIYPNDFIKKINITNVIREYLAMIKNDIINKLTKEKKSINSNKIEWVLSVPQSWNEFQKQIILNSALESGLSNISFIYESEAASLSIYMDKSLSNDLTKRKTNFILIDIGGINTQFSVFEISKDNIKEKILIKNNILENTGFLYLEQKIIKILEAAFGNKKINKIKKEDPGSWLRILKDISKAIENTYRINGIEIFDIYIPFSNKGKYEYKYKIDNNMKKYEIKYGSYNLIIPSGIIGDFILETTKQILNNTNIIIEEMKSKRININNIVITGGFSRNKIIQNDINNYFIENDYMKIHYLSSNDDAISKGGVLYGLNKTKINSRYITETIGIKLENEIKILLQKGKSINNSFTKVIYIKPSFAKQKIIQMNVYSSKLNEFLNENDVIGRLIIDLKNLEIINDVIKVKIFYDVVLRFQAYDAKSGNEIGTKFEYFK